LAQSLHCCKRDGVVLAPLGCGLLEVCRSTDDHKADHTLHFPQAMASSDLKPNHSINMLLVLLINAGQLSSTSTVQGSGRR
jgi:hypothetical protein